MQDTYQQNLLAQLKTYTLKGGTPMTIMNNFFHNISILQNFQRSGALGHKIDIITQIIFFNPSNRKRYFLPTASGFA